MTSQHQEPAPDLDKIVSDFQVSWHNKPLLKFERITTSKYEEIVAEINAYILPESIPVPLRPSLRG